MNKSLPEPGIGCYDDLQLMTMFHAAGEELRTRGWKVDWTIGRKPSKQTGGFVSKSQLKRLAVQRGEEYIPVSDKVEFDH